MTRVLPTIEVAEATKAQHDQQEIENEFSLAIKISAETAYAIKTALDQLQGSKVTIYEYLLDPDRIRSSKHFSAKFKDQKFVQEARKARIRIYESENGIRVVMAFKGPQLAGEREGAYKKSARSEDEIILTNDETKRISGNENRTLSNWLQKLKGKKHGAIIGFSQRERQHLPTELLKIESEVRDLLGIHVDIFHPIDDTEAAHMLKIDIETIDRDSLDEAWTIKTFLMTRLLENLGLRELSQKDQERASKKEFAEQNWGRTEKESPLRNPSNFL